MLNKDIVLAITVFKNYDSFKNRKLNEFCFDIEVTMSVLDQIKYNFFYENNKHILDRISKAMCKPDSFLPFMKEPRYPQESFDYALSYFNKKLLKCKEGGEKFIETKNNIEHLKVKDYFQIVTDCYVSESIRNLRDFKNDTCKYEQIETRKKQIAEEVALAEMTIEEITKKYNFYCEI